MGKRTGGGAGACVRNEEKHYTDVDEREMAEQVNRLDLLVWGSAYCIENYGYMWMYAREVWISASAKRIYTLERHRYACGKVKRSDKSRGGG
jgi:hypothetical protein